MKNMSAIFRILGGFALGVSFLSSLSCASYFKRKECEQINWYQHGQSLAQDGRRINEDNTFLECQKVEAEISHSQLDLGWKAGRGTYCTGNGAFGVGKNGKKMNMDLCEPGQSSIFLAKHTEGVRQFCLPSNAQAFGASGQIYNGICPADMEGAFQAEYKGGRKKYLVEMVRQSQAKIQGLEQEIQSLERDKMNKALMLATLPPPTKVVNNVYDPMTRSYKQTESISDPSESKRTTLNSEISSMDSQIRNKREGIQKESTKMFEYQRELNTY